MLEELKHIMQVSKALDECWQYCCPYSCLAQVLPPSHAPAPSAGRGRGRISALTEGPQEHRWGLSHLGHWKSPLPEGQAYKGRREVGGKGTRRQEITVPLEKGKELAWFGWWVGRGPTSRTS